jgi:hypothetical protein
VLGCFIGRSLQEIKCCIVWVVVLTVEPYLQLTSFLIQHVHSTILKKNKRQINCYINQVSAYKHVYL